MQLIDRKIQLLRYIRLLRAGSDIPGHPLDPLWDRKKFLAIQHVEFSHYRRGVRLHSWSPGLFTASTLQSGLAIVEHIPLLNRSVETRPGRHG